MKKKFLILAFKCLLLTIAHAQEASTVRTVSGIVTDHSGNPLPFATVAVKETTTGTVTNIDGKYSLTVPENAILVFSFLGFVSQEIAVDNLSIINVMMEEPMIIKAATPIILTEKQRKKTETANNFAFKMFREVSEHNTFFSPFSLNMLLGMLYNGSSDDTRTEIENALGIDGFSESEINEFYKKISQALLGIDPLTDMIIANSIWINDKISIKNTFIEAGKNYFNTEVRTLDFSNPNISKTIDNWVAEKTRSIINSIGINPQPDDFLYLINALYFKSEWQAGNKFDRRQTRRRDFRTAEGKKMVYMMEQTSFLSYYADRHLHAIELPYGNGAFSMVVLLPTQNRNINQLIDNLDNAKWQNIVSNMNLQQVHLRLPRFKIEDEFLLRQPIMNVGMKQMFSGGFANITDLPLWVSEIIQKTHIEVNEEGTEAAAVTAVVLTGFSGRGRRVEPIRFFADRPFMFLIRERSTGTILFMGRVDDPNG